MNRVGGPVIASCGVLEIEGRVNVVLLLFLPLLLVVRILSFCGCCDYKGPKPYAFNLFRSGTGKFI